MARPPGTYSLLIALEEPTAVDIGALGAHAFDADWYVYTGSAFGPGGLARVDRHHEIATGEREARHWHLDYLLGDASASVDAGWTSPGAERECAVATAVPGKPVSKFGASDCDCEAHLGPRRSRASGRRARRPARATRRAGVTVPRSAPAEPLEPCRASTRPS